MYKTSFLLLLLLAFFSQPPVGKSQVGIDCTVAVVSDAILTWVLICYQRQKFRIEI